jgi:hypothetical protein
MDQSHEDEVQGEHPLQKIQRGSGDMSGRGVGPGGWKSNERDEIADTAFQPLDLAGGRVDGERLHGRTFPGTPNRLAFGPAGGPGRGDRRSANDAAADMPAQ